MLPEFIRESLTWGPVFAGGVVGVFILLALASNLSLAFMIRVRRQRNPDSLDTLLLATLRESAVMFLVVLGVFLGFIVLTQSTHPSLFVLSSWGDEAGKTWVILVILLVTHAISRVFQTILHWYISRIAAKSRASVDNKLAPVIGRTIPAIIYPIGILVALDTLGVSINPLLAGLGIGGLAVALALSPTIASYISGTYIVTEGQIKEGDYIELEGGPAGFVVAVGWRSTTVRSRFNNLVIIPNSKLSESIVTNYSTPTPSVTSFVEYRVSFAADLDEVEGIALEVVREFIEESDLAVKEFEPRVRFTGIGESNVDFRLLFQGKTRVDTLTMRSVITKRLHARFRQEGIEINYPVRKLLLPISNGHDPELSDQISMVIEQAAEGRPASHVPEA